jgi:hypothetical protein
MGLTEPQLRHLIATLATVETWLAQAEAIASSPYEGVMTRIQPPLTPEQRHAFLQRVTPLRREIARAAEEFALARSDRPAAQVINALLSMMWETLEDARPSRLVGYGALDPKAAKVVAAHVEILLDEVERLRDAIYS